MIYYVDCNANGNGTKENPFRTISQAAEIAVAGDEIIVKDGIYREEVSPVNAGCESAPILYRAENSRGAKITGADIFKGWENVEGDVWKLTIDDEYFGSYNPYKTMLSGDWLDIVTFGHTGEVFLNGKAMYEKKTIEEVKNLILNSFHEKNNSHAFLLVTNNIEQCMLDVKDIKVDSFNLCGL